MPFLGRHYTIPLNGLASGVADNAYILEFRAVAGIILKVSYIQGHYENPASGDQVSMALIRASAATPGASITPELSNKDDSAAQFTVSSAPTAVTPSGIAFAHFGGIASSPYQWYPPNDGPGHIIKDTDIVVLVVRIAPGTSRILRGEIGIEEL